MMLAGSRRRQMHPAAWIPVEQVQAERISMPAMVRRYE